MQVSYIYIVFRLQQEVAGGKCAYSYLDANEVSVLMISHLPGWLVIDPRSLRHWYRLPEVDEPDASLGVVVNEQERAADQLQQGCSNF